MYCLDHVIHHMFNYFHCMKLALTYKQRMYIYVTVNIYYSGSALPGSGCGMFLGSGSGCPDMRIC